MVAVIGDIHGCYYTLVELYDRIAEKYGSIPVYSVGDLVDRGNHSFEVIRFVIENNIKVTPGNHDYMFYHFFKDPTSIFARSWVFNGNESTLESYEQHPDSVFGHIDYIKSLPLYYWLNDCFISHAGISNKYRPLLPLPLDDKLHILRDIIYGDHKNETGVLWARGQLMNVGRLQVVGHTKHQEITYNEEANSVYIDTGACVGNKLSAIIVKLGKIVDSIEVKTHLEDII